MAAFFLLTVVGAWAAWRSNPLYSTRATFRFVGVVGLAIAAVVGAIVAAVNLTSRSSPVVTGATLGGVILLGTLALIWVIEAASVPSVLARPAGGKLVTVHRAKLMPWLWRFCAFLVVTAALALVLPGDWRFAAYTVGGMFGFLGVVLLFTGYVAALAFDRSLTSVEREPWLHWRYTPEQWKTWSDVQVARMIAAPRRWVWRRDWKRLLFPVIATVGGVYVFNPGQWLWDTGYLGFLIVLMAVIVGVLNRYEKTAPLRFHRLLMRAVPEAYFGAAGVFADGIYTEWQTVGNYLLAAGSDERPPRSLVFRFEKTIPGAYSGPIEVEHSVLVPDGAESDVARLQTALSAACPSARVTLS